MSEDTPDPEEIIIGEAFHEKIDRPRAALTRTDRELLQGMKEYDSEQAFRNARHRLREHIRHSLHDLFLISHNTPQSELEQLLEKDEQSSGMGEYTTVFHSTAAFTLASRLSYIGAQNSDEYTFEEWIESFLSLSIRETLEKQDKYVTNVDVDISIDVEDSASDELIDEFIFGTPDQMSVISYLRNGDAQLLRERLRELDETISFAEDTKTSELGPDDELFDMFISADSEQE